MTFAALLDDLEQRGLMGETLVVVIGEFGRTPRINSQGGRDHWGRVLAFVPPYDTRLLLDTDFASGRLLPIAPPSRERGWRAAPLWDQASPGALSAKHVGDGRILLGFGLEAAPGTPSIAAGARAILAQEIRNARGGHYTFTVRASGGGTSADYFERVFLANFTCRLLLFRFANTAKDPRDAQVLASATFRPRFGAPATFSVDRFLGSTVPGANFAIGNGLGVAVLLEKSQGTSEAGGRRHGAGWLSIHSVTLDFQARPRDESVTI